MPTNHTTNGAGDGASSEAETCAASRKPPLETALAKIESIKGSYREAVRGLNDLAEVIKQAQRENKSTEKEISSVRQTIRQIQAVRI